MNGIDWSKARATDTHYDPENRLFVNFDAMRDWNRKLIPRPSPAWNGEGLPPIGTVCQAFYMGHPQGVVTVRYSGQCMILWSEDRNSEQCGQADDYWFKPIRTPEQIAKDDREHKIRNAFTAISLAISSLHESEEPTAVAIIKAMIDAGYEKQASR
jgi:hypothetical protein